ncbi:MAG TPA: amino acid racemase [Propionibacteriaceae bacterium]|nr:amino acid racemase [Propionibacteriaceae bacterium]
MTGVATRVSLVVGVLGGMGPMATADTFRRLVLATPARTDQEHLHIIVDSDPSVPDRTAALLHRGADPRPWLEASGRRLAAAGAEIVCMPCNTAHAFHSWLQERIPVPIVNMLEETGTAAAATGCTSFGLLATAGTVRTGLYQGVFERRGLTLLSPSEPAQDHVSRAIAAIKAGESVGDLCGPAVRELLGRGIETLVVGCTELSLIAGSLADSALVIDALDVLVRVTVEAALQGGPVHVPPVEPRGVADVA